MRFAISLLLCAWLVACTPLGETVSSQNQSGGVTAKNIGTVNIFGPAPPTLELSTLAVKALPNGKFYHVLRAHIVSSGAIGVVKIDGDEHVESITFQITGDDHIYADILVSEPRHLEIANKRNFTFSVVSNRSSQPQFRLSIE